MLPTGPEAPTLPEKAPRAALGLYVRSSDVEREYEQLLLKGAGSSVDGFGEPDRERVAALVQPLQISGEAECDLISKLYRIAAAFRVSKTQE